MAERTYLIPMDPNKLVFGLVSLILAMKQDPEILKMIPADPIGILMGIVLRMNRGPEDEPEVDDEKMELTQEVKDLMARMRQK